MNGPDRGLGDVFGIKGEYILDSEPLLVAPPFIAPLLRSCSALAAMSKRSFWFDMFAIVSFVFGIVLWL